MAWYSEMNLEMQKSISEYYFWNLSLKISFLEIYFENLIIKTLLWKYILELFFRDQMLFGKLNFVRFSESLLWKLKKKSCTPAPYTQWHHKPPHLNPNTTKHPLTKMKSFLTQI